MIDWFVCLMVVVIGTLLAIIDDRKVSMARRDPYVRICAVTRDNTAPEIRIHVIESSPSGPETTASIVRNAASHQGRWWCTSLVRIPLMENRRGTRVTLRVDDPAYDTRQIILRCTGRIDQATCDIRGQDLVRESDGRYIARLSIIPFLPR